MAQDDRTVPRPRAARRASCAALLWASAAIGLGGCGDAALRYTEVKRIDEKITDAELARFLAVVDDLPDGRLPDFPAAFAPPPQWSKERSLPVRELVDEQRKQIEERWDVPWQARHLRRNRALQRVLRRRKMTAEQFIGLSLAIGVALGRETLDDDHDLQRVISRGEAAISRLRQDERSFSSISPEGQHSVLRRATWLTRVDRAEHLAEVPPENVALVREHLERLREVFPPSYTENPLDAVADLLEERGMPFDEPPGGESDEELSWERGEAVIGYDAPDGSARSRRRIPSNRGRTPAGGEPLPDDPTRGPAHRPEAAVPDESRPGD